MKNLVRYPHWADKKKEEVKFHSWVRGYILGKKIPQIMNIEGLDFKMNWYSPFRRPVRSVYLLR